MPYGEFLIKKYLNQKEIFYIQEYSFLNLQDKSYLRFDFAVFKDDKLLGVIEHDGKYHFNKHNGWKTRTLKRHDKMKDEYCKQNNIPLLRINTYKNIDRIIDNFDKIT